MLKLIALLFFGLLFGVLSVFVYNRVISVRFEGSKKNDWRLLTDDQLFLLGISENIYNERTAWNYKNTSFLADIVSDSEENSSLQVVFRGPKTMPFLGKQKDVDATGCGVDNSFLQIDSPKLIGSQISFFTYAKPSFELVAFCLDENCIKIGGVCKLHRFAP